MIKRSLFFSQASYLKIKNQQLIIEQQGKEKDSIPIEDIGFMVLDHPQINLSSTLISQLTNNNVAVIYCNERHHPTSMILNLESHSTQQELFSHQIQASQALKKQLWQQTIKAKITNQVRLLKKLNKKTQNLEKIIPKVLSGDTSNCEAIAAKKYWKLLFPHLNFKRERFGDFPNNFLNYAYAILRAATARALAGSGLLCTLGIHHHNRYNAFCLADDIMEPYRPYIDELVYHLSLEKEQELTTHIKMKFLQLLTQDTNIKPHTHPLMIALTLTSSSLSQCLKTEKRKMTYPLL